MADMMTFPKTFEEFAEQYKIVDKEQIYTNGTELIPIFRVKQWLEDRPTTDVVEVKHGYWKKRTIYPMGYNCSECNNSETYKSPFCRLCGTKMDGKGDT